MLLFSEEHVYFGTDGTLGFDTLAAQAVLSLKKKHPRIKLILVLPCPEQKKYWSKRDKRDYEAIKQSADKIVSTSQEYTKECMHQQTRPLVENSSVCIAYLNKTCGGTRYTVNYALRAGIPIRNLATPSHSAKWMKRFFTPASIILICLFYLITRLSLLPI